MRTTTEASRTATGSWLKDRREKLGITQREIAKHIGLDYYTLVSQIEAGKARVPPGRYADYARALKMTPQDFVKGVLRSYDSEAWKILFGQGDRGANSSVCGSGSGDNR